MAGRISLLVTVKAYPAISAKYGEVVCVAGVRTDTERPEWARLYSVAYRDLPFAQRFKKYQHISLEATSHGSDTRPESYRPKLDTLEVGEFVTTKRWWGERWPFIEPLLVESMCEALSRQKSDGTSLAAFRPGEILDLLVDDEEDEWAPEKAGVAAQPSLFFPGKQGLEKIPHRFRYVYRCSTSGCRGHTQSMIDWELAQAYREWRVKYGESMVLDHIRRKFLEEMCGPTKDTVFFVGDQHQYPGAFLVLGFFWPEKREPAP